jgi:hypothetical protein
MIVIAVLAAAGVFSTPPSAAAEQRIVAVGDVHGAYGRLVTILQEAGLIDADTHWIGGSATFIQTGDLFDRGLEVFEAMDLLMRLQEEAAAAGGRVEVLLGNHEGMNLIGFLRDVNPGIYARLADEQSEKRRKQRFKGFRRYLEKRAAAAGLARPVITDELREKWMQLYPPGRIEYEEAIGPDGRYGSWLRTLPVAVLEQDTLFIHAGLGPAVEGLSVEQINAEVASELEAYDRTRRYMIEAGLIPPHVGLPDMLIVYRELPEAGPELAGLAGADGWLIYGSDGPLWYRGAATLGAEKDSQTEAGSNDDDEDSYASTDATAEPGADEEARVAAFLERLRDVGAERMVGGHTPQKSWRIETRLDGRVILIDTGMLSEVYGGRPSALVIEGDSFTAVYPDGTEPLEVAPAPTEEELLPAAA